MFTSKKLRLATSILLVAASTSSFGATEIIEDGLDYNSGPTYGSMVLDTAIGRPLQAFVTAFGAVTWVASLPFSVTSNSVQESAQVLVNEPANELLYRCLGCTPKQDATRRTYSGQSAAYSYEPVTFYEGDALENTGPRLVVHPYQH